MGYRDIADSAAECWLHKRVMGATASPHFWITHGPHAWSRHHLADERSGRPLVWERPFGARVRCNRRDLNRTNTSVSLSTLVWNETAPALQTECAAESAMTRTRLGFAVFENFCERIQHCSPRLRCDGWARRQAVLY